MRPRGRQPTRLLCPWDSPGKNTEVGCLSFSNACMHAKSLQLCPPLCNPMDSSPPGSSVRRILQARILEWVAISSPRHACRLSYFSCVRLCANLWTATFQASLSTGFSKQEYWSGCHFFLCLSCAELPNSILGFYLLRQILKQFCFT